MGNKKLACIKRYLIYIVFLLVASATLAVPETRAGWFIYKSAQVRDQYRNSLKIDVTSNGRIRIRFFLSKPKPNVFSNKLPLYKVDNGKTHDLRDARGLKTDAKKSRWVIWTISKKKNPVSDGLKEIMNGNFMTLQYYLSDGTIKETTFDIKDADKAIYEIIR